MNRWPYILMQGNTRMFLDFYITEFPDGLFERLEFVVANSGGSRIQDLTLGGGVRGFCQRGGGGVLKWFENVDS